MCVCARSVTVPPVHQRTAERQSCRYEFRESLSHALCDSHACGARAQSSRCVVQGVVYDVQCTSYYVTCTCTMYYVLYMHTWESLQLCSGRAPNRIHFWMGRFFWRGGLELPFVRVHRTSTESPYRGTRMYYVQGTSVQRGMRSVESAVRTCRAPHHSNDEHETHHSVEPLFVRPISAPVF